MEGELKIYLARFRGYVIPTHVDEYSRDQHGEFVESIEFIVANDLAEARKKAERKNSGHKKSLTIEELSLPGYRIKLEETE